MLQSPASKDFARDECWICHHVPNPVNELVHLTGTAMPKGAFVRLESVSQGRARSLKISHIVAECAVLVRKC